MSIDTSRGGKTQTCKGRGSSESPNPPADQQLRWPIQKAARLPAKTCSFIVVPGIRISRDRSKMWMPDRMAFRFRRRPHRFDLRPDLFLPLFLEDFFELFFALFFGGTFFPSRLASDKPIAIACFRLVTFLPDPPLRRVPCLRFFIARPTLADAFLEYFRAITLLPFKNETSSMLRQKFHQRSRAINRAQR
jgi:hypothetical protein